MSGNYECGKCGKYRSMEIGAVIDHVRDSPLSWPMRRAPPKNKANLLIFLKLLKYARK